MQRINLTILALLCHGLVLTVAQAEESAPAPQPASAEESQGGALPPEPGRSPGQVARDLAGSEISSPEETLYRLGNLFETPKSGRLADLMSAQFIGSPAYHKLQVYQDHFLVNTGNTTETRINEFILKLQNQEKPYISVEFEPTRNGNTWRAVKVNDIQSGTATPFALRENHPVYTESLPWNEEGAYFNGFVNIWKKSGLIVQGELAPSTDNRKARFDGVVIHCKPKHEEQCSNTFSIASITLSFAPHERRQNTHEKWGWLISGIDFKEYDLNKKSNYSEPITGEEIKRWQNNKTAAKKSAPAAPKHNNPKPPASH